MYYDISPLISHSIAPHCLLGIQVQVRVQRMDLYKLKRGDEWTSLHFFPHRIIYRYFWFLPLELLPVTQIDSRIIRMVMYQSVCVRVRVRVRVLLINPTPTVHPHMPSFEPSLLPSNTINTILYNFKLQRYLLCIICFLFEIIFIEEWLNIFWIFDPLLRYTILQTLKTVTTTAIKPFFKTFIDQSDYSIDSRYNYGNKALFPPKLWKPLKLRQLSPFHKHTLTLVVVLPVLVVHYRSYEITYDDAHKIKLITFTSLPFLSFPLFLFEIILSKNLSNQWMNLLNLRYRTYAHSLLASK